MHADDRDPRFLPPEPSPWPRRLLLATLGLGTAVGAVVGGNWLVQNHANIELVAPWNKGKLAPLDGASGSAMAPADRPTPDIAGGELSRSRVNTCAGSTPGPECAHGRQPAAAATAPAYGDPGASEIARIRAANANAAPGELKGHDIAKSGAAPLVVGKLAKPPAEGTATPPPAIAAAPDKGQECEFLKVRADEIDQMLKQSYPTAVKNGLRDEQKKARARVASLGC